MLALPSRPNEGEDLTMAVLGCGNMGIAILSGILSSISALSGPKPLQTDPSQPAEEIPSRLPTKFIACVRRPESAKKVKKALWQHTSFVKVVQNENVAAVSRSDVVLLSCKPSHIQSILAQPGMAEAMEGKLLISIAAGVTVEHIRATLHEAAVAAAKGDVNGAGGDCDCRIVRALPNTASLIREGMTVIADSEPALPPQTNALVTWIFRRIGDVVVSLALGSLLIAAWKSYRTPLAYRMTQYLPTHQMDASTALIGSGPAFFSLVLEAAIDGAVAMGLPRAHATRMAAQSMHGTASLVLDGEHPALLRDKVSTPGGCTIGGLLVLEEGGVRGTVSRAVREAACVAAELGRGKGAGVNGTRFVGRP
ncbi:hypothetical protein JX265_007046 [Neoarthrinium moseri]|uniref:Pyrroline-5-carboxylate reductase n=1 Tax=Neoarthrinium moseri TaxID=1658444 RepID=A0A9P9WKB9_9PEZI|nr:uncharacterized protein JN550_007996 [Neoarthrinium moseri]KAI1866018.1 hypothetical protein JN550_007996 [Neoarthrinium moseri]KAI1868223.1 hypothetical protein JX265_007046 [Neoarthrinium moseri]